MKKKLNLNVRNKIVVEMRNTFEGSSVASEQLKKIKELEDRQREIT